jgi:hypothetical protein
VWQLGSSDTSRSLVRLCGMDYVVALFRRSIVGIRGECKGSGPTLDRQCFELVWVSSMEYSLGPLISLEAQGCGRVVGS